MTHPDRRRYGGLDPRPPDAEEIGPARFEADFSVNLGADTAAEVSADASADYSADTSTDFPAQPTGPAAAGFRRRR